MIANKRQAAVSLLKATLLVALTGSFAQAGEFLVKYKKIFFLWGNSKEDNT